MNICLEIRWIENNACTRLANCLGAYERFILVFVNTKITLEWAKKLDHILQMMSQSIADDVTITRKFWREHVKSDIHRVRYRLYSRRFSRPVE